MLYCLYCFSRKTCLALSLLRLSSSFHRLFLFTSLLSQSPFVCDSNCLLSKNGAFFHTISIISCPMLCALNWRSPTLVICASPALGIWAMSEERQVQDVFTWSLVTLSSAESQLIYRLYSLRYVTKTSSMTWPYPPRECVTLYLSILLLSLSSMEWFVYCNTLIALEICSGHRRILEIKANSICENLSTVIELLHQTGY